MDCVCPQCARARRAHAKGRSPRSATHATNKTVDASIPPRSSAACQEMAAPSERLNACHPSNTSIPAEKTKAQTINRKNRKFDRSKAESTCALPNESTHYLVLRRASVPRAQDLDN